MDISVYTEEVRLEGGITQAQGRENAQNSIGHRTPTAEESSPFNCAVDDLATNRGMNRTGQRTFSATEGGR
jgi:hypothetical protein